MSRSYRKFFSRPAFEYRPRSWGPLRLQERMCIQKETRSADYGETLFPQVKYILEASPFHRYYLPREEVRKEYFQETGHILNDFRGGSRFRGRDFNYRETFLGDFSRIRDGEKPYEPYSDLSFDWLKNREVKKAVKAWKSDPLDVLYYLTRRGLIEKTVIREHRRRTEAK